REEGTLQQRQREGGEGDQRQQREGGQRRQQSVEGVGGIEAAEGRGEAGRGQRRRQIVRTDGGNGALQRAAAQPLAAGSQRHAEDKAGGAARAGAERQPAMLVAVLGEEQAGQRQDDAAQP